jgi:hypothetical protein
MWTISNKQNLEIWFKMFKATLIDLGFARNLMDQEEADGLVKGLVVFFNGLKDWIAWQLDETDGSLDETTGQREGGL